MTRTGNDPRQILQLWLEGIKARDLDRVLGLYSRTAVLLPTFSNKCLTNPTDIRRYFEKLARHKILSVLLHEKTLLLRELSGGTWALSGIYRWEIDVDGEPLDFEARFTFIVDPSASNPILHHHSSQVPRTL